MRAGGNGACHTTCTAVTVSTGWAPGGNGGTDNSGNNKLGGGGGGGGYYGGGGGCDPTT